MLLTWTLQDGKNGKLYVMPILVPKKKKKKKEKGIRLKMVGVGVRRISTYSGDKRNANALQGKQDCSGLAYL